MLEDNYFKIEPVSSAQSLTTNIDGDEGPKLPVEVTIHKQALPMLIPNKEGRQSSESIFNTK